MLHIVLVLLLWRAAPLERLSLALDPPPPYLTRHYRDTLVFHLRGDSALPAGGWRLFGDSLLQGLPAAALSVRATNYGIGADDTVGLGARLPRYGSVARADGVLLAVGLNDLKYRADEEIVTRYAALVDALPPAPRVVCQGVLPIDDDAVRHPERRSNARIRALNASVRTLCEERGHGYLPPPPALYDPDGNLRDALHEGDGVHLAAAGYALWLAYLDRALSACAPTRDASEVDASAE